jgi:BirA family biotin operon repressor/biotin-[acetyl-CoA-carboxylase] ligase
VNVLRQCGYSIESITNRGYKLLSCPNTISQEEITCGLKTKILAKKVYLYDSIDSTNEEAKRQALSGAPNGSLFIAEQQLGGKGRLGRVWSSPPGTGLWFSILLRSSLLPLQVTDITLIAGLAVCRAIRNFTGCPAMIKWPNDIVIGSRKVCGILTEIAAEIDRVEYIVVGIGINVNNTSFPDELSVKATSLHQEINSPFSRVALLQEILLTFETLLVQCQGDNCALLTEYRQFCVSLNRTVGFTRNKQSLTATAVDISPQGELIVRCDDGTMIPINSGEVTVQGLYGQ